jgi:hypothetical protein
MQVRLTAEAQRAQRGRGGMLISNLRFEISNLQAGISKPDASTLKPQRPLCVLCASAVNWPFITRKAVIQ